MNGVATGNVYGLFFLAASGAVVLLALSAYVFGRWIGHDRGLSGVLGLVGVFTLVGGVGGLAPSNVHVPLLLGGAFLYVPVGVGGLIAKVATAHRWGEVCRSLIGGWMAALTLALVTQAAGASLGAVISWGPPLFGLDWYVGFLTYMAVVGVAAGVLTVALLSWSLEDFVAPPV